MDDGTPGTRAPDRPGAVEIRRLVPSDAPAYVALRLAALTLHPAAFTSSADEEREKPLSWAEARIRDPARPDDAIFGAFDGPRLVGTAGLRREARPKERHKATLFGMAVAPEAAGRGIGGLLVSRLVAEARRVPGLLQILLTVTEGNRAAERLYASRGFSVFGRETRAVLVDGAPAAKLHMILMLDGPETARRPAPVRAGPRPPSPGESGAPAPAASAIRHTLVIGGARSGKSREAEALARGTGLDRVYLATATAWDDEMRERIARHRAGRAADGWLTVEEPLALPETLLRESAPGRLILVDCLTLWLTNVTLGAAPEAARDAVEAAGRELVAALGRLSGPAVLVSNEVGGGIVPENRLARDFRDAQGLLNQRVAEACGRVVLVTAGLPLILKDGSA